MIEIHASSTMEKIVEKFSELEVGLPDVLISRLVTGFAKIGPCLFLSSSVDDHVRREMQNSPPKDPPYHEYTFNKAHIEDVVDIDLFAVSYCYALSIAKLVEANVGLSVDVVFACHPTTEFGPQAIVTFYQAGLSPVINVGQLDSFAEPIFVFRVKGDLQAIDCAFSA